MATGVLIIGESGSGKSTSIRNLDPNSTFIFNVQGKPLPFKGGRKSYSKESKNIMRTDKADVILSGIIKISNEMESIKTVIIDDFQYIMVNEMMRKAHEVGYNKFTDIALSIWCLLQEIQSFRDDLIVVFLAHTETTSHGKEKVKTVGKMLDDQVNIEGMFSIVLKAVINNGNHKFTTHSNGFDTVKSPMGMFDENEIDNDLQTVINAIKEY